MQAPTTATWIHRSLYWLIGQLSFNRITVRRLPVVAATDSVLYLGLHRNGALDGVPYLKAVPAAACLLSAQLHRSLFGRLLFPGIAVARQKDRSRGIMADNAQSIDRCVAHLAGGGKLLIMPEGTSSLGPRHLPFKLGAARIARETLANGCQLTVVPLAVHYECAWEWQSRVEVVAGPPLLLTADPELPPDVDDLQRQFTNALEKVGLNVASMEELRLVEMLAYGATLGSGLDYAACLQRFGEQIPDELRRGAAELTKSAAGMWTMKHQGIPLVPIGSPLPYLAAWLLLAPLVVSFLILNLPPIAAAYLAGRKLADDINVVAFWRALVGTPSAILWTTSLTTILCAIAGPASAIVYLIVSIVGLKLFYRFRKLSIAVFNSLFAPRIKQSLLTFRAQLLRSLGND